MLGVVAGVVAITCLIITQYPGHPYQGPDYPGLALFFRSSGGLSRLGGSGGF
jgi:hypothetical protein